MQAYSLDLRERVVADREAGRGTAEVADKYRPAWVLLQRYRATGQLAPIAAPVPPAPPLATLSAAQPDAPLAERGPPWASQSVCPQSVRHFLTVKKSPAREQDRPDVVAARQRWRVQAAQLMGSRLVFLDETAVQTKLTRRSGGVGAGRAWSPKSPTATGRPPPSWRLYERIAAPPRRSWTAQSMAPALWPMSNRCSSPPSTRARGRDGQSGLP